MENQTDSLLSFGENPDYLSSVPGKPEKKSHFQHRRIFIFLNIALVDMIVFFQRACPTVVTDELANAYDVQVSQLGVFTSMFYIPYSLLQPFAGLLADVMEPSFIIGCSTIISSIGAIICGLSQSLFVGCIGRIIVGTGCGLIYSPCNRIIMNWFPLQHYSKMLGVFLFIAGLGNFLAQTPLTLLASLIGWRWCFLSISFVAIFLAIITLIFVRGNPVTYGYPPVNKSLSGDAGELTISDRVSQLMKNLKTIITNSNFWLIAIFIFFANGSYYNITGIWGGPYLKENLGYDPIKASNALLGLSLGSNFGSLLNPYVPEFICKSKKRTLFFESILAILCCIPLGFFPDKLNFIMVIFLLTVFAVTTSGASPITYPYGVELFHPSCGASVSGCLNCFAFLSLIIFMPLTGKILEYFGTLPGNPDLHHPDGFKFGLWVFNMCGLSIGSLLLLFVRKPKVIDANIETLTTEYDSLK
ncbi:hypothetical protein M9Y10_000103 [Tritrichomonas musculus]|uniref:Major facilitator superfamily (MFS) profile domain-containing protein n=1 Tax=Tritrichomonas musculus TaxID=1915356 RepID=A0ABR2L3H0_9EUKA